MSVTLHEAIEHAREVSLRGCTECHKEHGQLADWLEELEQLRGVIGDTYDLDRLRELVEADKAGRCVAFSFKVGDSVFKIKNGKIESDKVYRITIDVFGDVFIKLQWERESMKEKDARKTLFFTKEAAEASIAKDVCYE